MMPRLVLVTGANGFVGKALVSKLQGQGVPVRGSIRGHSLDPGEKPTPGTEFCVVGDLGPDTEWQAALEGVDVVVHLAARAHILKETDASPEEAFQRANVMGTERLARQAAAASVKRLIYVSSVGVQGKRTGAKPFSESDSPAPHDLYSRSKLEAERALTRVARETGLEVVILRPPLIYGPGNPGNFLRLLKLVSKGLPLPLGAIHSRRSFLFLGNLLDVVIQSLTHPAVADKIYLLSDGEDVSTSDLIRSLGRLMRRPARLIPIPVFLLRLAGMLVGKSREIERLTDPLVIDISRIKKEMEWTPPFSLEEGLKETVEWFLQCQQADS